MSDVSEQTSPHVMSESQTAVQDQRCQSGPFSKKCSHHLRGKFSKNYGADQQRVQFSHFHFDKFPTSGTFACWKIRFKIGVYICLQFLKEVMQWIKEVEMDESVDDLKSSCSIRGIRMPDFEVLDAKIVSALNRVIHNTRFKRKVSLEYEKPKKRTVSFVEDRSLARSTSTSGSLEPMILSDLFTVVLRNDDIQNSIRHGTDFDNH